MFPTTWPQEVPSMPAITYVNLIHNKNLEWEELEIFWSLFQETREELMLISESSDVILTNYAFQNNHTNYFNFSDINNDGIGQQVYPSWIRLKRSTPWESSGILVSSVVEIWDKILSVMPMDLVFRLPLDIGEYAWTSLFLHSMVESY